MKLDFYSRDNRPDRRKDLAYIITLNEYSDIGTHWIALSVLNINVTYSVSFGVEHIPKETKKLIDKFLVTTNMTQ